MTTHKAKRLAISGPTGSGKTTLAQDLARSLQVPVLKEDWAPISKARDDYYSLIKDKTSIIEEKHAALQDWKKSYKTWLDTRYQKQSELDGYVSDRWAADAYSNWLRVFIQTKDDQMARYLMGVMREHSKMYDFFVLLPVTEEIADERNSDGIKRNSSLYIRIMAAGLTAGLISHFLGRPIIEIPSRRMSRVERVNFVLHKMNSAS
jgi:energy-coupling factor transporter ATP-binding protein EcfA2